MKNLLFPVKAFTLLELLALVAVVVILAAVLIPAGLRTMIKGSSDVKCVSNLRQIATMALNYAGENNGWFPHEAWEAGYKGHGRNYAPEHYMLAYEGFQKGDDGKIIEEAPPSSNSVFRCPAEASPTDRENLVWFQSHYGFNQYLVHMDLSAHPNPGIFGTNPCRKPLAAVAKASQVFLVGDCMSRFSLGSESYKIGFRHGANRERFNVAFVDGHVESTDHAATGWNQYIEWGGIHPHPTSPRY